MELTNYWDSNRNQLINIIFLVPRKRRTNDNKSIAMIYSSVLSFEPRVESWIFVGREKQSRTRATRMNYYWKWRKTRLNDSHEEEMQLITPRNLSSYTADSKQDVVLLRLFVCRKAIILKRTYDQSCYWHLSKVFFFLLVALTCKFWLVAFNKISELETLWNFN